MISLQCEQQLYFLITPQGILMHLLNPSAQEHHSYHFPESLKGYEQLENYNPEYRISFQLQMR